ncbi:unnamed protein product [Trichobilharzia szidati]|nr:unnamed protein product [Trichobilharzia szidati]
MPQDSLLFYAATAVRNLKLLGYTFETHNVPKDSASFLSFFKVCRKIEFMHMLHFLFKTLDPLQYEAYELSSLVGPKSELKFKNATYRWLRILSVEFPKIVSNFFAVWGFPAGFGVLRLLANLSTYVLCVTNNLASYSQYTGTSKESVKLWHNFFVDSCCSILSETELQDQLKVLCCTLQTEIQDKLKEVTECKQRILLDANIQKRLAECHSSFSSGEIIDLPDELINYKIQLEQKVASLRQQLTEHLKNHAPSLLLLSNIVEKLDEKEPCILDGYKLKIPCADLENLTSNEKAELKQDENGKLNLRLFLHHSIKLFQLAVKQYTPLIIMNSILNANGETLFKQTVDQIYSQGSELKKYAYQAANGSSSSSSEVTLQSPSTDLTHLDQLDEHDDKELAQLMKEMQESINGLYADLQNEWLQGSYRQLKLHQIKMIDSKSPRSCIRPRHQSSNKNSNNLKDKIHESFDTFLENSRDESNVVSASTSSISIGFSDSVHMSQILPGKSLDRSNCQSDLRMNSTFTSPTESSSSSSAVDNNNSNAASNNDISMNTPHLNDDNDNKNNNTTVNVSLSPEENSFYTTPKCFNSSPSASSLKQQEIENDLQKLGINPTDAIHSKPPQLSSSSQNIPSISEETLKFSFPITKPSSSNQSNERSNCVLKDLSNVSNCQLLSVSQEISGKFSPNQLKTSFNLMDDDLDFVNELLPSSPN